MHEAVDSANRSSAATVCYGASHRQANGRAHGGAKDVELWAARIEAKAFDAYVEKGVSADAALVKAIELKGE